MDDHVDVKVEEQANDLVDEVKVEEDEGEFFFDYYNSYSPTNLEMRDPLDDLEDDDDDLSAFCITPDRLLKKERRGRKITRKRKTQDSSDTATSSKRLKIHNIRKPSLPHQLHLCPCCPSTFETIKAKNTHVSTTHPETSPYPCPICGRRHHFPTALAVHMVTRHETGEKKVSCDKCAKKFVLDQNFQRHIKLHEIEDVKPAVCDVCDSRFKDDARLAKHVEAAHAPRSVHVCDICGKQFDLVTGLKEHVKRLHGPKKVVCDTCGEKFVRRQALTSHRIKEHGADPFMCDQW
ncbi:zinc finger and BTB domain-containing protein 17 [Folsomia candida]|uniref:zinc finger and BTB domain-containing protein 17 n=2 Tax=Folsomia candida TaxID=158441 RepID=UPI000B900117|nr:zinc finger and BTB domain-containing protein 17 [Folsomia candida]